MNILDTSFDSLIDAQPITSGTLDFLQLAYKEGFTEAMKAAIGQEYDPTKVYLISGGQLENIFGGDTWTVATGSCFYNGEYFLIDGVGGSGIDLPDYIGMTISTTQYTTNADPTTFYSGAVHDVHNIRKMVYYDSATPPAIAAPTNATFRPKTLGLDNYSKAGSVFQPNLYRFSGEPNGYIITFEKDKIITWKLNATTDPTVITLSNVGAKQGARVRLFFSGNTGLVVNYSTTSSIRVVGDGIVGNVTGFYVADIIYTGSDRDCFVVMSLNDTDYRTEIDTLTSNLALTAATASTAVNLAKYETWQTFSAAAGWTNVDVQFTKNGAGNVMMRGQLYKSSSPNPSGESIGTLPSGYRPPYQLQYICGAFQSGHGNSPVVLQVRDTGVVYIEGFTYSGSGNYTIYTANINFLNQ